MTAPAGSGSSRPAVVVGVDPGGRTTGIIARCGDNLLGWCLVERDRNESLERWVWECTDAATAFVRRVHADLSAVEAINEPSWHVRQRAITLLGVLDTQAVVGALIVSLPTVVLVPPQGHGSGPLTAYPSEIVGPREQRGTGPKRHLRSAWDIAGVGAHATVRQAAFTTHGTPAR